MNSLAILDEYDDLDFLLDVNFNSSNELDCRRIFAEAQRLGIIDGEFQSPYWKFRNGIKCRGVRFAFDYKKYRENAFTIIHIPEEMIVLMLKCYAMSCYGLYIANTVAEKKIKSVIHFIEEYDGNKVFKLGVPQKYGVLNFLKYIGISERVIDEIDKEILEIEAGEPRRRKLKPFINYLAFSNSLARLYEKASVSDEEFIKWFPLFFWTQIGFRLPLRPTEMLVTPYECIVYDNGIGKLRVRRTILKGNQLKRVYYDVEKDYVFDKPHIFPEYVIETIKKYQELTSSHKRRFLFDYSKYAINDLLSLRKFNDLIKEYFEEKLIGNSDYDYSRFASGIQEFEAVKAGDARHIALSNLTLQDIDIDIVMELAGHTNESTTEGYATNASKTLAASAVMRMQCLIWAERDRIDKIKNIPIKPAINSCISPLRTKNKNDFRYTKDCEEFGHKFDCNGCKYWYPTEKELNVELEKERKELEKNIMLVIS